MSVRARAASWVGSYGLVATLLASGLVWSNGAPAAEPPGKAKRYRVIFNCDGHAVAKDAQGDLGQWLENLFGPLAESHVDALFWCDGAGGNTANYDSQVLERTGARANLPRTYIDRWIAEGNDPPAVVVREAKKRQIDVFYSLRFNDIHDSFIPDEMPTFKVEHPEWMLGEQDYDGVKSFKTSLNFAFPGVRELKFRTVEELFQKYDFDGLEIDFLRGAPYFLPGTESQNAPLLTQLLTRIRRHLTQRAAERGRPIRLAVRVDESLKSCRLNGFEVARWIELGLIDMLAMGSGVMDIQVEEFKALAAPKEIQIYPCLYGWPSRYSPVPAALAAGLALNYHAQGADGIYLFNWFPHTKNNSESTGPYQKGLLKLLGDPAVLQRQQQQLLFAADRGRPQRAYQYNWLHCVLPEKLPVDKPLEVALRAFARFPERTELSLQIEVDGLQSEDMLAVTCNGTPITGWQRSKGRLQAKIGAAQLRFGVNRGGLQLVPPATGAATPRTVTALELHATQPAAAP